MLQFLFSWDGSLPRAPKRRYLRDLVLKTAPVGPVVDSDTLMRRLRVDDPNEKPDLEAFEAAAMQSLDGYSGELGRAILEQQWTQHFDHGFPRGRISLLLPPLISVDRVAYVDPDGAEQELAADVDFVVLDGPVAALEPAPGKCWPSTRCQSRAVSIDYTCGYGGAEDVPGPIAVSISLITGSLYADREGTVIDATRVTVVENPVLDRLLGPLSVKEL